MSFITEEFASHPELIPEFAEVLGYKIDDPKFGGSEGGKLVLQMLLDWDRMYTKQNQSEKRARKIMARYLMELATTSSGEAAIEAQTLEQKERYDFFFKLARELDVYGKI